MARAFCCDILVILCLVHCVLGSNAVDNNQRLISNSTKQDEEFPPLVSVHLNYNNEFVCAAAVISEYQVLTLAHCLYYSWGGRLPPIIISINSGGKTLNTEDYQNFAAYGVTFHEWFNRSEMKYDLAVIDISVKLTSKNLPITPLNLPSDSKGSSYSNCMAIGWNNVSSNQELINVAIIDCNSRNSTKICAKHVQENDTLCNMVPGSLLVCNATLVGMLSVVPECNSTNQVSLFENTKYANDFLRSFAPPMTVLFPPVLMWIYGILTFILNVVMY